MTPLLPPTTSQQQKPTNALYKKIGKKSGTSKIKLKETESSKSNSDITVQISNESEDFLDDSQNKLKKLKRKKSLTKTKSTIQQTPLQNNNNNNNNKKLINKSSDDLLTTSSFENNTKINSKTEESEDGLTINTSFTASNTTTTTKNKGFVDKISKKITSLHKKHHQSPPSIGLPTNSNYLITSSANQLISPIMTTFIAASTILEQDITDSYNNNTTRGSISVPINNLSSSQHSSNNIVATFNSNNIPSSKRSNNQSTTSNNDYICLENDCLSNTSGIPFIVEKCIAYIEEFGLESEGIYRVPGHKQYTDSLFDDLINRQDSIDLKSYNTSQINVNIVATVIKEYFRHLKEPIIGSNLKEFIDLSKTHFNQNTNLLSQITQPRNSISNTLIASSSRQTTPPVAVGIKKQQISSPVMTDCLNIIAPVLTQSASASNLDKSLILSDSSKLELIDSIKIKFRKLNRVNYLTLKGIFLHLNLVALNCSKNNMDSTNLAICWWPTLLRPKFEDFNETEMLRKTLQPFIKFIIDNAKIIFEEL
jgi:hypothetical protein